MTVLEYLQSLDSETRVAVVGYTDNVLQGIRSLDAKTAAAASFGTWACSEYLAQQVGLAFEWVEYVKGRRGDKAVLRYLEYSGFFTSPASTKYHGAFPSGLCYHSVNVATEMLGLLEQHQLEDANLRASAVTCALLHDICKAGTYRRTTKRQHGLDGEWKDVATYEYDDSTLPLGHGEKSLYILQHLGMELTDQEAAAIRWHMGAYRDHDCYNEMGKAFERYALALFLHLADMVATYWWES